MVGPASPVYEGNMENAVVGPAEPIYLVNPFTGEPYVLSTLADVAIPSVDSVANVLSRDVVGNKGDVADESTGTASLVALLRQALSDLDTIIPSASHHEHVFPRSDGRGTAGDLLNVITDADDESNAAASGKESRDINFHDHRIVEALGLFILRALNQTDNTNGAHFHAAPSYEN